MYGVAPSAALFCGESMFSRRENASKVRADAVLPTFLPLMVEN
jgi:Leu/Phe-tRNA-protein transferase